MIIYFSATGNCEYVAKQIAKATNDVAVSMMDIKDNICLSNDENLGVITPTYFWGLPTYVDEFFEKIKISHDGDYYAYYVATYGTTSGQTGTFIRKHLASKDMKLHACFSVKMVDNWTPVFNVSNKENVDKTIKKEPEQIEYIIKSIKDKNVGNYMRGKIPMLAVKIWKPKYEHERETKHLHVESGCIGCSLCEKQCPVQAIVMREEKPVWIKDKCTMCLGCLHKCPKFAIQYDNKTKNHGQYIHPKESSIQ